MKSSTSQAVPFMAILMLLLILAPTSEAAISCTDVFNDLLPCLIYLQTGSGKPPSLCCAGASKLVSDAKTTADRQAACNCIKSAPSSASVKPELAEALPGNCRISLPFTVSPSVDCSKIT